MHKQNNAPKRGLKLAYLLALALAFSALSGCSKPEDKLGDHLMTLADIMNDYRDEPEDGVAQLRYYLRAHLPEMLELSATLVVELDEIKDDGERKERAKEIASTLKYPAGRVAKAGMRFGQAVEKDKAAQKLLMEIGESYMGLEDVLEEFAVENGFGGKMDKKMDFGSSDKDLDRLTFEIEEVHYIVTNSGEDCASMGSQLSRLADRNGNLMQEFAKTDPSDVDESQQEYIKGVFEKVFTASMTARQTCGQDTKVNEALDRLGL